MSKLKLSAPWYTYFREIEALFEQDPEITIRYTKNPLTIKLYVDNEEKADAIMQLLPTEKIFGETIVNIKVIPSNKISATKASLFKTAFEGNPIFSEMIDIEGVYINPIHYCVFKKEVVQYWNDNLADPHGNVSTLYQNIAEDIFQDIDKGGVIFCTDNE